MSDTYIGLFENENLETLEKDVEKCLSDKNIEVVSIRKNLQPNEDNKYLIMVVYKFKK
ncbi:MAG: hypothetical protein HXL15_01705 [Parvimonas sp.]|jgi:hypothetical protein|nr:hypothetical protein [Parvimonas sp.]